MVGSHSYLVSSWAGIVFKPWNFMFFFSILFLLWHWYLKLINNLHAKICFHSHFFATQTSLDCRKYLIGRLFYGKLDELLPRSLYRICVAVHVIKVRKEEAMDDATLLQYRQRERERERERAS